MRDTHLLGLAYTIATGRLFTPFEEFQVFAEKLLGRPVMTHEFADHDTWVELRGALETQLLEEQT